MSNIKSGIYKITNTETNKFYIGSSKDIEKRISQHLYFLRNNNHINSHLQFSYNKYGEDKFIYEIIEEVNTKGLSKEDAQILLFKVEQKWIDKTNCSDGEIGYNISSVASKPKSVNDKYKLNCNYVYVENSLKIVDLHISDKSKLFYYMIREFTHYKVNSIIINNSIPTWDSLSEKFNFKLKEIIECLIELENNDLLTFTITEDSTYVSIYINPLYYSANHNLTRDNYDYIQKKCFEIKEYTNILINNLMKK